MLNVDCGDMCVMDSDSSGEECAVRSGEELELECCDRGDGASGNSMGAVRSGEELELECCDRGVTCDGERGNSVGVENSRGDSEAGLGDSGIDAR